MNNNKPLSIISLSLLVSATAFAANDEVSNTIDVPQTLQVSTPSDPSTGDATSGSAMISTTWTVTSNNAFAITFTGSSFDEAGSALSYPQFIKEDVDASGAGKGTYDVLSTAFGVEISGHDSVAIGSTWGGGNTPTGTPSNLVLGLDTAGGPDAAIGSIMTDDNSSTATVTLHAKGDKDNFDQSGNYSMAVTITTTAEEQ